MIRLGVKDVTVDWTPPQATDDIGQVRLLSGPDKPQRSVPEGQTAVAYVFVDEAGNKAAEIEIELFTKAKQNRVVKAVISKGKSEPSWYINGKAVNKQALHDLTQELQIQPGNLCQFLPQDVVREFPQMKPLQIFENTIKVGSVKTISRLIPKR